MKFNDILRHFKHEPGYAWCGDAPYEFWGGLQLYTYLELDYDGVKPSQRQLRQMLAMVNHPTDIRPYFEEQLFKKYQAEIYGTVSDFDRDDQWKELTPTLYSSQGIWDLICGPSVHISFIADNDPEELRFRLCFECQWDEEHGLTVGFLDWKIERYGD